MFVVAIDRADPPQADDPTPQVEPKCDGGRVPWEGRCLDGFKLDIDEKRCPGGLVVLPEDEERHRCVTCSEVISAGLQPAMAYLTHCSQVEATKATRDMDREYQKLLKDSPYHAVELRADQAEWMRKRDAACDAVLAEYDGGTGGPMNFAGCQATWAKERIKAIRVLRTRWSKH